MPYADVNGVRINYVQIGRRTGAKGDLVMIHGLATSMAFWYFQHAQPFSQAYRVTVYDLRGHGRSGMSAGGYTPGNMGIDLRCLLDHLGIERAHFIAHSFGGAVALNLACLDQSRFASLVLVDSHIAAVRRQPSAGHWLFGEKIQPILKRHGIALDIREPYFGYRLLYAAADMYQKRIALERELEEVLRPLIGPFSKRTALQWLHLCRSTRAGEELMQDDGLSLDRLRRLRFPILAVYGEHSQAMSTGRQLLDVWPHARFHKIRAAGHFFPATRADEFRQCCRSFLENATPDAIRRRSEDSGRSYFRSDRFYSRNDGAWFVDTREATKTGPFNTYAEANAYLTSILSGHA